MIDKQLDTREREAWIDITAAVGDVVRTEGLAEGLCVVSVPHTTAAVTIQENADPDVKRDCLMALERLAPATLPFRHAEGNSPAHVKAVLTGSSVTVPVRDGRLALGTWQAIYFCEYDGPRRRRYCVSLMPAGS